MSKNDGGPAFPFVDHAELTTIGLGHGAAADVPTSRPGMSLRDWFAGQVVPALAFAAGRDETRDTFAEYMRKTDMTARDLLAATAYQMADAMLKARGEGS